MSNAKKKYTVKPPIERFNKKYSVDKNTGCWVWEACKHKKSGYAKFSFNGTSEYAHRVSYILHVGEIPEGLIIDHLCRNTSCVNPEHLEVVTFQENSLRKINGLGKCEHGDWKRHCHQEECQEYFREQHNRSLRAYYQRNIESESQRKKEYYSRKKSGDKA